MAPSLLVDDGSIYLSPSQSFYMTPFSNVSLATGLGPIGADTATYPTKCQQPSPAWDSFMLPSPLDQASPNMWDFMNNDPSLFAPSPFDQNRPATPKFINNHDLVLFPQSPLEQESPGTPDLSDSCPALFHTKQDLTYSRKDSSSTTSTHVVECSPAPQKRTRKQAWTTRKAESASISRRRKRASLTPESSWSSSEGHGGTRRSYGVAKDPRKNHNTIEKRYRTNLNKQIKDLWQVIPSEDAEHQPCKAVVISMARDHILKMTRDCEKAKQELVNLRENLARTKMYEERRARELRHGGARLANPSIS